MAQFHCKAGSLISDALVTKNEYAEKVEEIILMTLITLAPVYKTFSGLIPNHARFFRVIKLQF